MSVVVHINIILLRLFVQLPISFPVLFYYSLVGMRVNLGASFVLILGYVSDRKELSLSEHKLENLFFFTCLMPSSIGKNIPQAKMQLRERNR